MIACAIIFFTPSFALQLAIYNFSGKLGIYFSLVNF